jgi:hypothetical protein
MKLIPNEFTLCESYRGWTIALRDGRYSIWNRRGYCRGGHAGERAEARRMIDNQIADDAAIMAKG